MQSHLLKAGITILGLAAIPLPVARASLMASLAPEHYQAHKDLAMNPAYRFAASTEITRLDGTVIRSSAVAIAPNLVLTAAHVVPSATSTASVTGVLFGPNVFAPDALRMSASRWERYPGYASGNTNTLDFGLIYLSEFIPGFTPVSFGSAAIGDVLTLVDYGNIAELGATTASPTLGDRLAGTGAIINAVSSYPSNLYFSTFMSSGASASSMDVMGIAGTSGSPFYRLKPDGLSYYITGIAIAATNGYNGGFTYGLRVDNADFLNFVTPKIAASWAEFYAQRKPVLSEVSIQPPAANQPPIFSGTVVSGPLLGSARLQASLDLGKTDPWTDVATATLDAVGSATFTNIPDSRPQAQGASADYFRVVTEAPSNP